jgi:hypothetical protein
MDWDQEIDRAIDAVSKKRGKRQPVDRFHVGQEEAEWLCSSGMALDEQALRFKAIVTHFIYEANERNISVTADALHVSFNTVKAHLRHYEQLSKD